VTAGKPHAKYRQSIRVINEYAWHNLFCAEHVHPGAKGPCRDQGLCPGFHRDSLPQFPRGPEDDLTRSGTFVALNISKRLVLIGGTAYAGEIKKVHLHGPHFLAACKGCAFHALLGQREQDNPDDVAIFFGLSGTGKTTLSADPDRMLIGDDEHGWSDKGSSISRAAAMPR